MVLELTVRPPPGREAMFQWRNRSSSLWFFERDFNQYSGVASGQLVVDGEPWRIREVHTLLEDAWVVL